MGGQIARLRRGSAFRISAIAFVPVNAAGFSLGLGLELVFFLALLGKLLLALFVTVIGCCH